MDTGINMATEKDMVIDMDMDMEKSRKKKGNN